MLSGPSFWRTDRMNNMQVTIDGQPGTIQDNGMVRFGSDDRVNVLFYKKSVHDPEESRKRGRPWSKSMDYVRIQQPGEKDCIDRPVAEDDPAKYRWSRHWEAYQKGQTAAPSGTPVDVLFPQSPEIAANLHSLGVHTTEQLAGLTEHGAQTIGMGATQWRNRAKEFLNAAAGGAGVHALKKQIEERDNKIEVMANQMAGMKAQLDRLMAQVDQRIPSAMIPQQAPTLAAMRFSNDGYVDPEAVSSETNDEFVAEIQTGDGSDNPLFVEEPEESASSSSEITEPAKRGWPKGKPRGSRAA